MEMKLSPIDTLKYIDNSIIFWRNKKKKAHEANLGPDEAMARCYVDAFQSVRISIFGELLPKEEECQTTGK